MVLRYKSRTILGYLLLMLMVVNANACMDVVTEPPEFQDFVVEELDTTYRNRYCHELKPNVLFSSLINMDGIHWTSFKIENNFIRATSSNPSAADQLTIVVPTFFSNSVMEYRARIFCKANLLDQEKVDFQAIGWVMIDTRSDTIDIQICDLSSNVEVNADWYNVDVSTHLRFAK